MPDLMFGGIVSIEFTRLAAFMMSCLDARASDAGLQASTPGFLVMIGNIGVDEKLVIDIAADISLPQADVALLEQ
jgi:hypothetical protein